MSSSVPSYNVSPGSLGSNVPKSPILPTPADATFVDRPSVFPRIIHQVWLNPPVPDVLLYLTDRMLRLNPGWDYKLWTIDNLPPLFNASVFNGEKVFSHKSDVVRYEIVARFGGVYVDFDMIWLRGLDELSLDRTQGFVAREQHYNPDGSGGILNNGVFGFPIASPPAWALVDRLHDSNETWGPETKEWWNRGGVGYFTKIIREFPQVTVLHRDTFHFPWSKKPSMVPIHDHPSAIALHFYNSWDRLAAVKRLIEQGKI